VGLEICDITRREKGISPDEKWTEIKHLCEDPRQMMRSRWVKAVSTDGTIRGVSIQATGLIQEMANTHGLQGEDARALGEAVIAALLLGSYCKEGERINLNVQGDGWVTQALVDAYPNGSVRGFVVPRSQGRSVQAGSSVGPWGSGLLAVLRSKGGEGKQPYIGTVPLVTGHLAKDLSYYWLQSEQVPSAVGIRVNLEGDQVAAAGGFLIQAMPGAADDQIRVIEHHIQTMEQLSDQLARHDDPLQILSQIFQSTAFLLLEDKPVVFQCSCSRERVERALSLLGAEELKKMLQEDGGTQVDCDFCTKAYRVSADELTAMIQAIEFRN
jgi:molecular chaperone Hsp33